MIQTTGSRTNPIPAKMSAAQMPYMITAKIALIGFPRYHHGPPRPARKNHSAAAVPPLFCGGAVATAKIAFVTLSDMAYLPSAGSLPPARFALCRRSGWARSLEPECGNQQHLG